MSYIGKSPSIGAYSMLDNLTASATASYSLTLDSVAFVPESANHLIVSLNGVIQKAGSSFTVSGSTLTFSSALTSSDSIDFVLALGNVLDIGTPSDATVTNAKTNFVSTSSAAGLQIKGDGTTDGTLQLNCSQNSHGVKIASPAHSAGQSYTLTLPATAPSAGKVLETDGSGNLSFASAGGGLTLISKTSGTSNVSNFSVDNVFTSTYDNYKVIMNMRNTDTGGFYLRLLKSDGTERASNYTTLDGRQIGTTGNFEDNGSSTNVSTYYIGRHSGSDISDDTVFEMTFFSPYLSSELTTIITRGYSYHDSQNGYLQIFSTSQNSNAETHRGFKFVSNSGNINPHTVRVYGYKNDV